ncbi:MAG: phenylalanine--tRNA ligase subunit alpha, partial [Comamonadaceae bacterium]|nr:phenylalanine--tRNA ligase subunit alpha [Comamonadaceae bacterium]
MNDLVDLVEAARAEFTAAPTPAALEDAKARFLGKSGRVTELLKGLAALAHEAKKARG